MKNTNQQQPTRVFSLGVILSLAMSALFFRVWYERYLSIEFNELGRYYDGETQIVYTDSAFVWCLPAFGFSLLATAKVAHRIWRQRADKALKPTFPPSTDPPLN